MKPETNDSAGIKSNGRRNFIKGTAAASLLGAVGISLLHASSTEGAQQPSTPQAATASPRSFHLEEATIADVHRAFLAKQLTAISYRTAPIDHVPSDTKAKLDGLVARHETLRRKDNGAIFTRELPIKPADLGGFFGRRAVLNAIVLKVMADHNLDAFVYPMKTVPAAILANPLEPENLKTISATSTVTINGVDYTRRTEHVIAERNPLGTELSTNAGLPAAVVPAGFTKQVYDRAPIIGKDGSKKAGELEAPKADALPVGLEFMGRAFSEPVLIRVAAAYEAGTRHRHPPKNFGPVRGEL